MKSTATGLFLSLLFLSAATPGFAQGSGAFATAGDMTLARLRHTATLLMDGRVLIVGGDYDGTAEIYDPATGKFTPTGNGSTGHRGSAAVLLPDGKVLIASGNNSELFDPRTETFTSTGSMVSNQSVFTATLLTTGKVLITGGSSRDSDCCAIADPPELYDPLTGKFSLAGPYIDTGGNTLQGGYSSGSSGLTYTIAAPLPDGKVLIPSEPQAEVYDPVNDRFSLTGSMVAVDEHNFWGKPTQIAWRTTTLMPDGKVLVAGGEPAYFDTGDFSLSRAEVYDPATGVFAATNSMHVPRRWHAATLLPDGTVLITGGSTDNFYGATTVVDIYDSSTGVFSQGPSMKTPRAFHQATLLRDGRVLVTGGLMAQGPRSFQNLSSAEIYTPAVSIPAQLVTDLQFDRTSVPPGSSFSANVSGSNLTAETFFDVRFTAPGSNVSMVALNWQSGVTLSHDVPLGTAPGSWVVNGVRPHRIATDHTGNFVPVSATLKVIN